MPLCFGAGLVALDAILNGNPTTPIKLSAGGSCGNVLSILSFFGWNSYPVARLAHDEAAIELLNDLQRWQIHTDFISTTDKGSTPIIIHRILKNKLGSPIHRFEFRDPETKGWLPQFKPITKKEAVEVISKNIIPEVFYCDRMNPGTLELAIYLKSKGTIIYFEPSSFKDVKLFEKFRAAADIIKFSHDRLPDYRQKYPTIQGFIEIETLGSEGLVYRTQLNSDPNQWKLMKGYKISNVQDAAGAGDWCTSGIINALCSVGKDAFFQINIEQIDEAIELGQALATLNCLYDGARGLMYYYDNVHLLSTVGEFRKEQAAVSQSLKKVARIDTSTKRKFSELYNHIVRD